MFDFLAGASIADVAETTAKRVGGPRKDRNPEGLSIRIFRDGSVYPSTELVSKFNLEFVSAVKVGSNESANAEGETKVKSAFKVEGDAGCGFDIIDTELFPAFKLPSGKRIILISPVNRKEGRVDLFASTTYNEDGTPKSSVLDQGAKTFGTEEFIPMLESVYGIKFREAIKDAPEGSPKFTEGVESVDLMLVADPSTGEPWKKDVCFFPKKVSRGKDAGSYNVARREYVQMYALVPATMVQPQAAETQATTEVTE